MTRHEAYRRARSYHFQRIISELSEHNGQGVRFEMHCLRVCWDVAAEAAAYYAFEISTHYLHGGN